MKNPASLASRLFRALPLVVAALAVALVAAAPKTNAQAAPPAAKTPAAETGAPATDAAAEEKVESLVVAFQPQENTLNLQPNAEKMAAHLSEALGIEVKVYLPTNYGAVVEAMRAGHADVAYFSARPYVLAHERAGAEALVAEVRGDGNTFYYSHWYALKDSGIATLADAKGKKAAFTSPTSTSGYLFPMAKLVQEGYVKQGGNADEFFSGHTFAGGYEQALRALLAGQVDVAASSDYSLERYLAPEEREKIVVLSKQGPVPSHLVAVRGSLPAELKEKLRAALLDLSKPENRETLKAVYGAEEFRAVTHEEHVAALAEALALTGVDPMEGQK